MQSGRMDRRRDRVRRRARIVAVMDPSSFQDGEHAGAHLSDHFDLRQGGDRLSVFRPLKDDRGIALGQNAQESHVDARLDVFVRQQRYVYLGSD